MAGNDPGFLNIDYSTLTGGAQDLAQASQAARTVIEDLKGQLNQNLGEWTGDARIAYEQVQRMWDQAFADMNEILGRASNHLTNAHDTYHTTERNNTAIWHH